MSVLPASARGTATFGSSGWLASIAAAPRNAGIAVLLGYRSTVSHLYGDVCKYFPSCSAYAVTAVQQYGLMRGSGMAAMRIARCHPWAKGGVDDVPPHPRFRYDLNRHGFVVSRRKD